MLQCDACGSREKKNSPVTKCLLVTGDSSYSSMLCLKCWSDLIDRYSFTPRKHEGRTTFKVVRLEDIPISE